MCNRPNPSQISLYFKCPVHNPHKHCQLNAACLRHWVIIRRWALHLTCKLTSPRVFAHLPDQVFFKWHLHANSSISEAQSELETSCSRKGRVMRKGRRKHGNNGVVKLAKKKRGARFFRCSNGHRSKFHIVSYAHNPIMCYVSVVVCFSSPDLYEYPPAHFVTVQTLNLDVTLVPYTSEV